MLNDLLSPFQPQLLYESAHSSSTTIYGWFVWAERDPLWVSLNAVMSKWWIQLPSATGQGETRDTSAIRNISFSSLGSHLTLLTQFLSRLDNTTWMAAHGAWQLWHKNKSCICKNFSCTTPGHTCEWHIQQLSRSQQRSCLSGKDEFEFCSASSSFFP